MNWFKRDNELVVHKAHSIREMQLWPSACPSCPHSNPENGAFLLCKEKPILSHRKFVVLFWKDKQPILCQKKIYLFLTFSNVFLLYKDKPILCRREIYFDKRSTAQF